MTENAPQAFKVKDCTLITRMGGIDFAFNLRELRERILTCPIDSLYHHFCETLIRPSFADPEFRNDFSVWSSRNLRDRVLSERLGMVNPYDFNNLEELRIKVVEIIDERLSELFFVPWALKGEEFYFMQATTVVFYTGAELKVPMDLVRHLPEMSKNSIYYHFIEARRRTPKKTDDFSSWLMEFGLETDSFVEGLAGIDFYFLNLKEIKEALIDEAYKWGASVYEKHNT